MLTVAYLANKFPAATERYVGDEIEELRRRGVRVIAGSVKRPPLGDAPLSAPPDLVITDLRIRVLVRAMELLLHKWDRVRPFLNRIFFRGKESVLKRMKALAHTCLGVFYAAVLHEYRVDHIHVHHGYFGSWIAMIAAQILDVPFSMSLHGSDLLLQADYLDVKLSHCCFCVTISEHNRRYILERYPQVAGEKVVLSKLGVDAVESTPAPMKKPTNTLTLLTVGRLHPVKNHAFLMGACLELEQCGISVECLIAGEGPERSHLQSLIRDLGLASRVSLLGHVPHQQLNSLYDRADAVVLTSVSEGIPLVLMEAMARGKIVVAPSITGIPELVIHGKTGFLYTPGSLEDFVNQVVRIWSESRPQAARKNTTASSLDWIRHAAQLHVRQNFNRRKNLEAFCDIFLSRIRQQKESLPHEDFVLQQI
jgi:colanic acid/amylovoran biosynthesis glycosyltransferase